jgi:hypothetical protein
MVSLHLSSNGSSFAANADHQPVASSRELPGAWNDLELVLGCRRMGSLLPGGP